jgi:hypothetical protein
MMRLTSCSAKLASPSAARPARLDEPDGCSGEAVPVGVGDTPVFRESEADFALELEPRFPGAERERPDDFELADEDLRAGMV